MSLINGTLSDTEKKKVKQFIDEALNTFQEVKDRKDSLTDLAKTIAEELGVKHTVLMKAARAAFKQSLEDDKEVIETVEELLVVSGRA